MAEIVKSTRRAKRPNTLKLTEEQDRQIFDMAILKIPFREIAAKLNIPLSTCHASYRRQLQATPIDTIAEMRMSQMHQLGTLYRRILLITQDPSEPTETKIKAIDSALRILDREARMWGLDAPQKRAITLATIDPDILAKQLIELTEELSHQGVKILPAQIIVDEVKTEDGASGASEVTTDV